MGQIGGKTTERVRFAPQWPLLVLVLSIWSFASDLYAQDRHAGFYYPSPQSIETYVSRATALPDAGRRQRIGFVVSVVDQMNRRPYPPVVSVFAKGDFAEKLIIVAMEPGRLDTIYRVRAYLAALTSEARQTPIFAEYSVEDIFTFLDFLKLMGFERLTVSDGDTFAHQINIE